MGRSHKFGLAFGYSQFIQYAVFGALYYFGALFMWKYGDANDKIFIAIFGMMFAAFQSGQAQQFGPDMGKAKSAAQRIFTYIQTRSRINPMELKLGGRVIRNKELKGIIEFKNVWFRYPTRKDNWVFKGLNLKIMPNESVAVVGESGAGKSTLVGLLLRFYDIQHGSITLDRIDIRKYKVTELRRIMGLVMQEPTLFNYTIAENILYGKNKATNEMIEDSAKVANALEFINQDTLSKQDFGVQEENDELKNFEYIEGLIDDRTPEEKGKPLNPGFEIECGLRGGKLSGGQKQRIAIARAVVRKPRILILDEATSALDENSQALVQEALRNVMKNRTSIVIAHRLTTVEKCSKVVVVEDGKIAESGTFNQLMNNEDGHFANLSKGMRKAEKKEQKRMS